MLRDWDSAAAIGSGHKKALAGGGKGFCGKPPYLLGCKGLGAACAGPGIGRKEGAAGAAGWPAFRKSAKEAGSCSDSQAWTVKTASLSALAMDDQRVEATVAL